MAFFKNFQQESVTIVDLTLLFFLVIQFRNSAVNLKAKHSSDIDALSPGFDFKCVQGLAYPSRLVFNVSMSTGSSQKR